MGHTYPGHVGALSAELDPVESRGQTTRQPAATPGTSLAKTSACRSRHRTLAHRYVLLDWRRSSSVSVDSTNTVVIGLPLKGSR